MIEAQKKNLAYFVWALIICSLAMPLLLRPLGYSWDFWVFYDAARSIAHGVNPYNFAELKEHVSVHATMDYTYLPMIIYLFYPFILLPMKIAAPLWLLAKLVALFFVIRIWQRNFVRIDWMNGWTILFIYLAFNATIFWDLLSGNSSVFQQILLWTGFAAFLKRKYIIFAVCVAIAAQVKIMPIAFLALLLFTEKGVKWSAIIAGLALFGGLIFCNELIFPEYFRGFLAAAGDRVNNETGIVNASSLAFIGDLSRSFSNITLFGKIFTAASSYYIYYCFVLIVGALSLQTILKHQKRPQGLDRVMFILFACVVYALVMPRLKSYAYIIVIPSALFILRRQSIKWIPLLAFLFCFQHALYPTGSITNPIYTSVLIGPVRKLIRLSYEYVPLIGLFTVWLLYIREYRRLNRLGM